MNIVFDLGGVVFNWLPDKLIAQFSADVDIQQLIRTQVLNHPDWVALDRGTALLPEVIDRAALRTGLPSRDIAAFFESVPPSLTPIHSTIDLLMSLSNTDNTLFVLSNMPVACMKYLEENYDFWNIFSGKVISCRVQHVKPEPAIYQYLLDEYKLKPEETVFIDDMEINVAAAKSAGIKAIQFINTEQCEQALKELAFI